MVALLFVDWLLQTNTPPRILQYTTIYLYEMKYQNNICNYSSDLCICCVAIHVPAKGTTELDSAIGHASTALQSTFPRRERQVDLIHAIQVLQVSIHVPAKGTTRIWSYASGLVEFQSTFPRRERLYFFMLFPTLTPFQSTFPRRERLSDLTIFS